MSNSLPKLDPQSIQQEIAACEASHTAVHRTLVALKQESVLEAKGLISKQMAPKANALSVL